MNYQELLRTHSYMYQKRIADISRNKQKLGLLENHTSIPFRQIFVSGMNETPVFKPLVRDEQLSRDGVGINPAPGAFPNTGYLGKGLGD